MGARHRVLAVPMTSAHAATLIAVLMLSSACGVDDPIPPDAALAATPSPDGPLTIELPGPAATEFATRTVPPEGAAEGAITRLHAGLQVDPCLRRAASAIAGLQDAEPTDLPLAFTEFVLHWAGCPDATASLSILRTARPDADLLADSVDDVISAAPATHVGVAGRTMPSGAHRWVVLLVDRRFRMVPLPARVEPGSELPVQFTLDDPFAAAELVLTLPRGDVVELSVGFGRGQAVASLPVSGERGRQWVELIGRERSGPRVLALFPLAVGVDPPARWAGWRLPDESWVDTSQEAEQIAATMILDDRQRFGLPDLRRDGRLDEIARAHSREMAENDFFAHISPITGSVVDRLRGAGYRATYASENIARSRTVAEAHHGLMRSPGHRAAILSPYATRFGVGAVIEEDSYGESTKVLTQIFVRPAAPPDPDRLAREVAVAIDRLRSDHGAETLDRTEALDRCAAAAARAAAADLPRAELAGGMSDCVMAAVSDGVRQWRLLSGRAYEATDLDLPDDIVGDYRLVGIAAHAADAGGTSGWAVVLVATARSG